MSLNLVSISVTVALLMLPITSANTAEKTLSSKELPEPLTLELALKLIDSKHPDLRFAHADLQSAESNLLLASSNNDLSINFKADARWIEPSTLAPNQSDEDHRLGLYVNKTLYDFGRSSALNDAANQQVLSHTLQYLNAKQQHNLNVTKRYLDVV